MVLKVFTITDIILLTFVSIVTILIIITFIDFFKQKSLIKKLSYIVKNKLNVSNNYVFGDVMIVNDFNDYDIYHLYINPNPGSNTDPKFYVDTFKFYNFPMYSFNEWYISPDARKCVKKLICLEYEKLKSQAELKAIKDTNVERFEYKILSSIWKNYCKGIYSTDISKFKFKKRYIDASKNNFNV